MAKGFMRNEISKFAVDAAATFKTLRPVPVQPQGPTPKQQVNEFLNMPREQRQALAMEMGPEAYQGHVEKMMDIANQEYGINSAGLLEYFAGDAPAAPTWEEDLFSQFGVDEMMESDLNSWVGDALK